MALTNDEERALLEVQSKIDAGLTAMGEVHSFCGRACSDTPGLTRLAWQELRPLYEARGCEVESVAANVQGGGWYIKATPRFKPR